MSRHVRRRLGEGCGRACCGNSTEYVFVVRVEYVLRLHLGVGRLLLILVGVEASHMRLLSEIHTAGVAEEDLLILRNGLRCRDCRVVGGC